MTPQLVKNKIQNPDPLAATLKGHVKALCDGPIRSAQNQAALDRASRYIQSQIKAVARRQRIQTEKNKFYNIVYRFGSGKRQILFAAHYDSVTLSPGADDNASGVATVIEVARCLDTHCPQDGYSFGCVFYGLEEPPYFRRGSEIHAQSLVDAGAAHDSVLLINLDMLGFFNDKAGAQQAVRGVDYPDTGDFLECTVNARHNREAAALLLKCVGVSGPRLVIHHERPELYSIDLSDNGNYERRGYDNIIFNDTAFYRAGAGYHSSADTMEKLNYERMAQLTRGLREFCARAGELCFSETPLS